MVRSIVNWSQQKEGKRWNGCLNQKQSKGKTWFKLKGIKYIMCPTWNWQWICNKKASLFLVNQIIFTDWMLQNHCPESSPVLKRTTSSINSHKSPVSVDTGSKISEEKEKLLQQPEGSMHKHATHSENSFINQFTTQQRCFWRHNTFWRHKTNTNNMWRYFIPNKLTLFLTLTPRGRYTGIVFFFRSRRTEKRWSAGGGWVVDGMRKGI